MEIMTTQTQYSNYSHYNLPGTVTVPKNATYHLVLLYEH